MLKYSFNDIVNIENKIDDKLDAASKEILDKLKNEINAPGYIKTPNFVKHDVKKRTKITKDENPCINEIKSILNKLSEKTYKEYHIKIIEILKDNNYSSEIYESIFNTIFKNKFFLDISVKLIKDLYCQENFEDNLINFISVYEKSFKNIKIVDESNYSDFCNENATNEDRLSITLYITKLLKNSIITHERVNKIISKLFKNILTLINENKHKKIIENYMNNVSILITELYTDLDENEIEKFTNILTTLSMLKTKDNNVTNKTVFMCLDLLELINNI